MEIIGHGKILSYLRGAISGGKAAQGFLFCGPRGVGKRKVAEWLAGELLGIKDKEALLNYPDVFVVAREIDEKTKKLKKNISVEQIREAIYRLTLSSFFDSYKVAIIDDAETLSEEAANSLLKTLEEPRNKVVVILISTSREAMPPTVSSRLQVLNFAPVSDDEIMTGLLDRGATRAQAEVLAKLALGKPGRALEFLSDSEKLGDYQEKAEWMLKILRAGASGRLRLVEECAGSLNKEELVREALGVLDIWEISLRDLAHLALGNYDEVINVSLAEKMAPVAAKFGGKILMIKNGLDAARELIAANVQSELAFKNIFLKI